MPCVSREHPTLEVTFHVFDAEASPESAHRRPAHVTLAFIDLHAVTIGGLGYQNPIQGLGIHLEAVDQVETSCFRVDWGRRVRPDRGRASRAGP